MKSSVNILVTCRKPELLPAALLVFKTVRVGFPTAGINVFGNGLDARAERLVYNATRSVDGAFIAGRPVSHGEWIEGLTQSMSRDFWICDTDVVFFDEVESWYDRWDEVLFAGRYEPPFHCDWTKALHVARLHPSLMWINTSRLMDATRAWPRQAPFFNTAERNLFKWHWVPRRERVLEGERCDQVKLEFYDTCAGLFHALGGTSFTDKQNAAFEHLYCGTYLDLIHPHMPPGFAEAQKAVLADHTKARGLWQAQKRYYKEKSIGVTG